MNFLKFHFYEARLSVDLHPTVSAIDTIHGVLYNLGSRLLETIVDDMCDVAELWKHEIENK